MPPIKSVRERQAHYEKIVNAFVLKKDVPDWYRGCSEVQWAAMDALQNAIRDDIGQDTAHRVYRCLCKIGITPVESNKNIKLVMKLSGGNDLAFLWFLMEMFYKSPNKGEYTLNEQLILSSIAHLDMVITLRGLEEVLPPGHPSKQELRRLEVKQRQELKKRMAKKARPCKRKNLTKIRKLNMSMAPYFQKLPKLVRIPTRALHSEKPSFKANLFCYSIYADPNYTPPNERNRWFAEMDNPSDETREHLENIFKKYPNRKQAQKEVTNVDDNIALDCRDDELRNTSSCKEQREEIDEKKRRKAIFERRETYLSKCAGTPKSKEEKRELIKTTLERDVANFKLAQCKEQESCGNKTNVRLLESDGFREFYVRNSDYELTERSSELKLNGELLKHRRARFPRSSLTQREEHILNCYCDKYNYGHTDCTTPSSTKCYFQAPTSHEPYLFDYPKIYDYEDEADLDSRIKREFCKALGVKHPQRGPDMIGDAVEQYIGEVWDEIEGVKRRRGDGAILALDIGMQTSVHNMNFTQNVKGPMRSSGGAFERKGKISEEVDQQFPCSHELEKQLLQNKHSQVTYVIERSSVEAATSNDRTYGKSEGVKPTIVGYPSIYNMHANQDLLLSTDRADLGWYKRKLEVSDTNIPRNFSSPLNDYQLICMLPKRTQLTRNKQTQAVEERPEDQLNKKNAMPPEMPRLTFYDCEDKELMHKMLKIGLKHLAKDPKYVLASLPDCHKLPLLREWTYQRYGKSYTKAQLAQSVRDSLKIFHALHKLELPKNRDEVNKLVKSVKETYACYDYLMERSREVKKKFYNVISADLMNQTRSLWLALRATLCEPSPRNMFFAYCPSNLSDIKHLRPWQPRFIKE